MADDALTAADEALVERLAREGHPWAFEEWPVPRPEVQAKQQEDAHREARWYVARIKADAVAAALAPVERLANEWERLTSRKPYAAGMDYAHDCLRAALAEGKGGEHKHTWTRKQNVTTSGYQMPAYEVCVCGAAREAGGDRG